MTPKIIYCYQSKYMRVTKKLICLKCNFDPFQVGNKGITFLTFLVTTCKTIHYFLNHFFIPIIDYMHTQCLFLIQVSAGYDNGDVKMWDLRNMKLHWDTNVGNGVCGLEFDRANIKVANAIYEQGGSVIFLKKRNKSPMIKIMINQS